MRMMAFKMYFPILFLVLMNNFCVLERKDKYFCEENLSDTTLRTDALIWVPQRRYGCQPAIGKYVQNREFMRLVPDSAKNLKFGPWSLVKSCLLCPMHLCWLL